MDGYWADEEGKLQRVTYNDGNKLLTEESIRKLYPKLLLTINQIYEQNKDDLWRRIDLAVIELKSLGIHTLDEQCHILVYTDYKDRVHGFYTITNLQKPLSQLLKVIKDELNL